LISLIVKFFITFRNASRKNTVSIFTAVYILIGRWKVKYQD